MRPVHEPPYVPRPIVPAILETSNVSKTLVIKEDPTGKKYIYVNNQCVPLINMKQVGPPTGLSRPIDKPPEPTTSTSKTFYIHRKVVQVDESMRHRINDELQAKLAKERKARIAEGRVRRKQYKTAVTKHRNSLLDIIQHLRMDHRAVSLVLRSTKREFRQYKQKFEDAVEEIKTLSEQLETVTKKLKLHESKLKPALLKSAKTQTEINGFGVGTQTDKFSDGNVNDLLVPTDCQGNTVSVDFIDIQSAPIDFGLMDSDPVVRCNVNMGCNLPKPVIVRNQVNERFDATLGTLDSMHQIKLIMFMCFQMCNIKDANGDYPIHSAVMKNDLKAVQRQCIVLKSKNICIDLLNEDGYTALHLAIANEASPSIVAELHRYSADFSEMDSGGNNAYHIGAMYGTLKPLEKNIDFFTSDSMDEFNYQGFTPLMLAIINKNLHDAELLIRMGVDVNLQDKKSGRTALFHAVESNSLDLVNLLLTSGVDRTIPNFLGMNVQEAIIEMDVSPALRTIFNQAEEVPLPIELVPKGRKRVAISMVPTMRSMKIPRKLKK